MTAAGTGKRFATADKDIVVDVVVDVVDKGGHPGTDEDPYCVVFRSSKIIEERHEKCVALRPFKSKTRGLRQNCSSHALPNVGRPAREIQ